MLDDCRVGRRRMHAISLRDSAGHPRERRDAWSHARRASVLLAPAATSAEQAMPSSARGEKMVVALAVQRWSRRYGDPASGASRQARRRVRAIMPASTTHHGRQ